jgi:hypothetical protein
MNHFTGGRVKHISGATGIAQQLAIDQVLDGAHEYSRKVVHRRECCAPV